MADSSPSTKPVALDTPLVPQTLLTQGNQPTPPVVPDTVTPPGRETFPLPSFEPTQIGRYTIEGVLGRGGMGVVYKARQAGLNRLVALKMILHADHSSTEERKRFAREAELLAALKHPNIVQVYEIGEHEGKPFISLEYVEGGSLDRRLQATPLSWREAVALMETLARAMHAAHQAGIVHRDLKPANVLLTPLANPKITDFGLAKDLADVQGLSASGVIMGTPSYMAPEQAAGQHSTLDARADVYALGAMLYECLTGRPPFKAATSVETILQVLHQEAVPPRRLQPATPRDLETICLKCLHKSPERRYGSAEELANDLHRLLAGEAIRARPVGLSERGVKWVRRRPLVSMLLALIALVGTAGIAGILNENHRARAAEATAEEKRAAAEQSAARERQAKEEAKEQERQKETQRAEAVKQKQQALREKARAERALSNSLLLLAQASQHDGNLDEAADRLSAVPEALRFWEWRFLQRAISEELFPLHGGMGVLFVAASADGQRIAAGDGKGEVLVWDAQRGHKLLTLTGHTREVCTIAFSPDGRWIASGDDDGVIKVRDAATGRERFHYRWQPPAGNVIQRIRAMSFSPDGAQLLYAVDAAEGGVVVVLDAASGRTIRTIALENAAVALAISPDGQLLATGDTRGLYSAGAVELREVKTGKKVRELAGFKKNLRSVAFDPGGRRLAGMDETGLVKIWDVEKGQERASFRAHDGSFGNLLFSPDGTRLATCGNDPVVKLWSVPGGKELRTFKGHLSSVRSVCFSPDGQRLISGGSWDSLVRVWDSRGSKLPFAIPAERANTVRFSSDGRTLAIGTRNSEIQVWDMVAGEKRTYPLLEEERADKLWFEPDEKTLLVCGENVHLVRLDLLTGRKQTLLDGKGRWASHSDCHPEAGLLASFTGKIREAGRVVLYRTSDARTMLTIDAEAGWVKALCFSPNARQLATLNNDGKVFFWDIPSGRKILTIEAHSTEGRSIGFSPNGKLLFTSDQTGLAKLWDARDGELLQTMRGSHGVFTPDSERLALAVDKQPGRLWDVETGQTVWTPAAGTPASRELAFSPKGDRLASVEDNLIRIWDPGTVRVVRTLAGHLHETNDAAFSPDGLRLATIGWDQFLYVWDLNTGKAILKLPEMRGFRVAFSSDGKRLLTQDEKVVRAWNAQNGEALGSVNEELPPKQRTSPDGKRIAIFRGGLIQLIDIAPAQGDELTVRQRWTAVDEDWHRNEAMRHVADQNWFAAEFHVRHWRNCQPWDAGLIVAHGRLLEKNGRTREAAVEYLHAALFDPQGVMRLSREGREWK